ncbi:unnamed protein product [Microthlaspi erraticum]|uniref:3'-5' exonuclease domain-containing protein n=1 Tax=Microthlaspi erraticum TaxID=1685480 RepID=A0A6D2LKQ2_9BRAS|nr:unnamed protein product [Microthlaspi erraticum]
MDLHRTLLTPSTLRVRLSRRRSRGPMDTGWFGYPAGRSPFMRRITFVGVWNSQDKKKLAMCRLKLEIWRLLDIRHYLVAKENRICTCSFEMIVKARLGHEGVRLEKEISMSDWDDEYLSHDQILQAAVDSYVSFRIGANMGLWNVGT